MLQGPLHLVDFKCASSFGEAQGTICKRVLASSL